MPANIPTEFAGLFAVSNASSMRLTREEMQAVRNTLTTSDLRAVLGETFDVDKIFDNAKHAGSALEHAAMEHASAPRTVRCLAGCGVGKPAGNLLWS